MERRGEDRMIFIPSGLVSDIQDKDLIEFLGHDAGEFLSEEDLGELEKYILELVGNDQDKL